MRVLSQLSAAFGIAARARAKWLPKDRRDGPGAQPMTRRGQVIIVLKKEFQGIRVICNHRVADEEMWTRTLSAGADDCCPSSDMRGILFAAVRTNEAARHMAA